MFRCILVAVDSSPQTEAVLTRAAELAARQDASLHVVSVADPARHWELGVTAPSPDLFERIDHDQAAVLRHAQARLASRGLACHTHAPCGDVTDEIVVLARTLPADLVVIGHRQLSWLGRMVERSVGSTLLARCPCSVLVVVESAEEGGTAFA